MGAAIALRLRRPPAGAGPGPRPRPPGLGRRAPRPENMRPYALVGELIAALPPDEARRRFEASATAADLAAEAPDNLASLRGFFGRPEPAFGRLLAAIAADGPGVAEDDIRRIAVPTLVIGHGRDLAHPLAQRRGAGRASSPAPGCASSPPRPRTAPPTSATSAPPSPGSSTASRDRRAASPGEPTLLRHIACCCLPQLDRLRRVSG